MIFLIIALVLIAILIPISRTPKVRGWIGEFRVKQVIGKNKENARYVIHDLRLRTDDGKTSQIDHVVIQSNGIFVIETKNYSGRIYGNDKQLEWTQVLQYGKVKNHFYSPVKQNKTHIYRINQILGEHYPITSAIVFVQGNIQFIEAENIYDLHSLRKLIALPISGTLSSEEMQQIYEKLQWEKDKANLSTTEHIANIQNMKTNIDSNICPRCGGTLILRKHNDSVFYGCSNYPKCRFTKKR